jgi:trimeric autotransporter adhesin
VIDSNGQLGTVNSSQRYKEDIQDMGEASRGLLQLRPVTFRYKQPFADGSKPVQYGLIAEEVAEVYPELVAHSADGEIESVKYQVLESLMLNELQRQERVIQEQQREIAALKSQLNAISAVMSKLASRLAP